MAIAVATFLLYGTLVDRVAIITHEGAHPYMRVQQLMVEVAAGNLPPLVLPDAAGGAGSAFFRFYPPLAYYVSAMLAWLLDDVVLGVNISYLASVLASGVAMYFLGVVAGGGRAAALAGALLYISFPYRFVDIFIRGALAEAWTFVWSPLVAAGAWRLAHSRRIPWYLPLAVAGLLLTHPISSLYSLPLFALLGLLATVIGGWRAAGSFLAACALGVGLSLWHVLPQQYCLPEVWASDAASFQASPEYVDEQRVAPPDLLSSGPTAWKPHLNEFFRTSITGRRADPPLGDELMSRELGSGTLVALVLWLILAVLALRRRVSAIRAAPALGLFALWVLNVVFMVRPMLFLDALPSAFLYVQFPWRMLAFTTFSAAAAVPTAAAALRLDRRRAALVAAAATLLVLLVPSYVREKWQEVPLRAEDVTQSLLRDAGMLGYTVHGEYLPKTFNRSRSVTSVPVAPQTLGDISITDWSRNGPIFDLDLEARGAGIVILPLIYYDLYFAATASGECLKTFDVRGLLAVDVPAGFDGAIAVRRRLPPIHRAGIALSAASLLGLVGIALRVGKNGPRVRAGEAVAGGEVRP